MKLVILGSLLLGLSMMAGCGKGQEALSIGIKSSGIINGVEITTPNIYTRHTVGIFNRKLSSVCTGVLIEENLVLTAAHCIDNTPAGEVEIVFSNRMLERNAVKQKSHNLIVHEQYDRKTIINDVALVRLSKALPAGFSSVDLEASRQLTIAGGELVTAVGYGVKGTGFFSGGGSGILRMGKISIDEYINDARLVLIDQKKESSICFGDSGGPTFTLVNEKAVLVGISSYVQADTKKKKYICNAKAYLSNPNFFYEWIQSSKLKI